MATTTKKKATKGRKPVTYDKAELERQPMIMLVCGETGVGKTYRTKLEVKRYMRNDPKSGKKARKVLSFDTNDDDYSEYRSVSPDHIAALTKISARRIRPFNKDGTVMNDNQKTAVVERIIDHYKNGMVILDDIDHYMSGPKGKSLVGALCTVRHAGIDMMLTHQSLAKISTHEWQNCTWLRLHHQVDDITRYRTRIPKYRMVRIAQIIVDEQYELAFQALHSGKITPKQYTAQKSFFVYVNMREQKIMGCSRAAFIRASKRYFDQEESRRISMMLNERSFEGKKVYQDRNSIVLKLVSDMLRYHQELASHPFGRKDESL